LAIVARALRSLRAEVRCTSYTQRDQGSEKYPWLGRTPPCTFDEVRRTAEHPSPMHPHDSLLPLFCPFPSRINPHVDEADVRSVDWASDAGLVGAPDVARLRAARFAWLSSRAYPTAPVDELVLVSQWNLWLFAHDDACDAAEIGRDPEAMTDLYARLGRALRDETPEATDPPLAHALHELARRIFARARPAWRHRFIEVVENYFAGCLWEARNRRLRRVPSVEEYVRMRRAAGAVQTAIELIEVCERITIDDEMLDHQTVAAMALACNDVVCWTNDLASLPKERAEDNVHNLVVVLRDSRSPRDWPRATAQAMDMLDGRVRDFMALAATVPSFGAERDVELARYIGNLRSWMRGNIDWALESGRYRVASGEHGSALDAPADTPVDPGAPAALPILSHMRAAEG
jgi:5-epi-alpha-selinene synthase